MTRTYRQGDILLIEVDEIPTNARKKNNILAKGEHTGHCHAVTAATVSVLDDVQFVESDKPMTVTHQEHENLQLPAGKYKVRIQRELDLLGEIRKVMD